MPTASRGWGPLRYPARRRPEATALFGAERPIPAGAVAFPPSRFTPDELRELVEQLKLLPGGAGSSILEHRFSNRHGSGVADLLDAPSFHITDPRRSKAGLPDEIAVVGRTLVAVEYKAAGEKLSEAQARWLDALAAVTHVYSGCVHPEQWAQHVDDLLAMALEAR